MNLNFRLTPSFDCRYPYIPFTLQHLLRWGCTWCLYHDGLCWALQHLWGRIGDVLRRCILLVLGWMQYLHVHWEWCERLYDDGLSRLPCSRSHEGWYYVRCHLGFCWSFCNCCHWFIPRSCRVLDWGSSLLFVYDAYGRLLQEKYLRVGLYNSLARAIRGSMKIYIIVGRTTSSVHM